MMRFRRLWLLFLAAVLVISAPAQDWVKALKTPLLKPGQTTEEVRSFIEARIAEPPDIGTMSLDVWKAHVATLRERTISEVMLRGEAASWRHQKVQVAWFDTIERPGYRIRKLRYDIAPGFWIPALLYEPSPKPDGKLPVVLNLNGHDGKGKAADYKQVRCINQAKRGMLALNIEWIGMGQLRGEQNQHYKLNQIDLCGTSGLAPFYLTMKRGLDLLLDQPHADPERVCVTGLSGGGCQTAQIMGLDPRVTLANPVAGYSSFFTRARHLKDLGDSEQTPSDLAALCDYKMLTAMRAPQPTLLTYNQKDQCCFAAPYALPPLLEAAEPVFAKFGKPDNLRSHINHDPGNHNFLQDNREALYRAFRDYWDASIDPAEIDVTKELLSAEELAVPLPATNHTLHSLAVELSRELPRPFEGDPRKRLRELVKMPTLKAQTDTKGAGPMVFKMGPWSVPAFRTGKGTPVVYVSDRGRAKSAEEIQKLVETDHEVLAIDPFFFGESKIPSRDFLFGLLVASAGERPLGIQSGQIAAAAQWLQAERGQPVTVVVDGERLALAGLVAGALEPAAITNVQAPDLRKSLREVITQNRGANHEVEAFCFGLFEHFDIAEIKDMVKE